MHLLVINADPINTQHICYYTKKTNDREEIALYEVVQVTYPHPEASNDATVIMIETRCVDEYKRLSAMAAPLVLLEACQLATRTAMKALNEGTSL